MNNHSGLYKFLANVVFVFHMLLVVYVITGTCLIGYYQQHPMLYRIHLIVVAAMTISQLLFMGCPLVTLEAQLRQQYNPKDNRYYGSFVVRVIRQLTGVTIPSWVVILVIIVVFAITAVSYFLFIPVK